MSGLTITHCQSQTDYNYKDMNHFESLAEKEEKIWPKKPVCNFLLKDKEKARRWTGLDEADRENIWDHLGEAKFKLKLLNLDYTSGDMRVLSVPCQFLLTLCILRKGFGYQEFADIFGVSTTIVTNVFKTWLYFLYQKFSHPEWKKTLHVKTKDLPEPPKVFRNEYLKKVRFVMDTTSIEVI